MTFALNEPEYVAVIDSVDSDLETVVLEARAVTTEVDELLGACRDSDVTSAVTQFRDDALDKALRALTASARAVVDSGRAVATSYRDFDAEVAKRASAAELGK